MPKKQNKDQVEELPIEEFENDTQNIREEFLKKFPHEDKEKKETKDNDKKEEDEKSVKK